MLLHVMDFDDNIVDSFGERNNAILQAKHERKIDENRNESEILTIVILTEFAEAFTDMRRILIQDENDLYREFIIMHTEKDNNGYSTIEATASYLIDIGNARSIPKGKYEKLTAKEMGYEILKGIRWELGTVEWAGQQTISWTSERTPFQMLKQMCTAFNLELDFTYEVDLKGISHRYVHFYKKKALFNGKEIKKGKDLISLKRISDVTELNTALIALGPEKDDGSRLRIEIVDEKAQTQFGANKRFIWGIYEPESDDKDMTESRLRTLANTELNKRNKIDVTYEVDALDIRKQFPHEVTRFGDIVRIKDRDFTPPLYAEAEVTGIEHDLVSDERKYTFGTPKEYRESDLRKYFTERLNMLRDMMKDDKLNLNQIVETVRNDLVERVEQVVLTGSVMPENPKEGQLWYDTSNPENAVLREYVGGRWLNATAEDVSNIGGLRREQIVYRELANTLPDIQTEHLRLQTQYYNFRDSEYFVDNALKDEMTNKYNLMNDAFTQAKQMFEALNEQDATIGQLTDVQAKLVEYRNQVQDFYVVVGKVDKSISERIKLLQSQYTDEKYNEAMKRVADTFGIKQDESGAFIGPPETIAEMVDALRTETKEEISTLLKRADYETDRNGIVKRLETADSERKQLSNEINDRVTITEYNSGMAQQTNEINSAKAYADAQDELKQAEVKAYADGIVTEEEQRAIADAQQKLEEAKADAETKANNAEVSAKAYADGIKQQTDQTLTTYNTRITQNGQEISQRATKEEFNASRKTLSQVISELTNSTMNGLTYTYDENGAIQSFNVGPNGTSINTSKLTIDAGDVSLKDGVFTVKSVNTNNVTIPRDDGGVPSIINGVDKRESAITGTTPPFKQKLSGSAPVFFEAGYWLGCLKRTSDQEYLSYDAFYFTHDRRYLSVSVIFLVGQNATTDPMERKVGEFIKLEEFSPPPSIESQYLINEFKGFVTTASEQDGGGRVQYTFVKDLGPPTGLPRQFYFKVKPNAEGVANPLFDTSKPYSMAKFQIRKTILYG
ncbi:phage tail protein [Staphylococcus chromogenes]|uniref:phage tail spike protein n=1 Tax=Staphylococcus chromogenes TaxID=46126 RepID=UPI001F4008E5|nr:phage tail spike protein [Staphylococcus chromogenes]MCE4971828.1 phage tail protein [Staphylococcus chromogenes]